MFFINFSCSFVFVFLSFAVQSFMVLVYIVCEIYMFDICARCSVPLRNILNSHRLVPSRSRHRGVLTLSV